MTSVLWVVTSRTAVTAQGPSALSEVPRFLPQVAEAPGAARCIGPGCSSVAQPDSVYCSSDCILKHAAAAMKSLSSGKEPRAKPKEKAKAKAEKLALPRGGAQVRRPGSRVPPPVPRSALWPRVDWSGRGDAEPGRLAISRRGGAGALGEAVRCAPGLQTGPCPSHRQNVLAVTRVSPWRPFLER